MRQKTNQNIKSKTRLNPQYRVGISLAIVLCALLGIWLLFTYTNIGENLQARFSGASTPTEQKQGDGNPSSRSTITYTQLPSQAQTVYTLIHKGGRFPYSQDGTTFGNHERRLPAQKRGYYREYTVPTPGVSHRGARRIVCGGEQKTRPKICYYTADHYASFRQIIEAPAS